LIQIKNKINSIVISVLKFLLVLVFTYLTLNNEGFAHFIVDLLLPIFMRITQKKEVLVVIFNTIPLVFYAVLIEVIYRVIMHQIAARKKHKSE
jgi:hypothetical protein